MNSVQMIRTVLIIPNDYNPNQMTANEFAELKTEVTRLGKPPKPLIVRPYQDQFQIVDGEHGWRAAKELDLPEVPCEVLDIDDFEARRQTYKRNSHGQNDPLKLGQMFDQMRKAKKLSVRKLAKEIDLPEATVRNYLAYVRALSLRTEHTEHIRALTTQSFGMTISNDPTPETEITALSIRQVTTYLDLPNLIRDAWLEAGMPTSIDNYRVPDNKTPYPRLHELVMADLDCGVSCKPTEFTKTLKHSLTCLDWLKSHTTIENAADYVRSVARWQLPLEMLRELPLVDRGNTRTVLLPAGKWEIICFDLGSGVMAGQSYSQASVKWHIEQALREAHIDPTVARRPHEIEQEQLVSNAPDFIRNAQHLSLEEKAAFMEYTSTLPEEIQLAAKRKACDLLHDAPDAHGRGRAAVYELVRVCVRESRLSTCKQQMISHASTPDLARQIIVQQFAAHETLSGSPDPGTSVLEVISSRLSEVDGPELAVIASLLMLPDKSLEHIADVWVRSVEQVSTGCVLADRPA